MKVQSFRRFETLEGELSKAEAQVIPLFASKRRGRESLIIDGPFAETKESCSHVAILARRRLPPEITSK